MTWSPSSKRRASLPRNWNTIRAVVLGRDGGRCTYVKSGTGRPCGAKATDVDHIVPHHKGGGDEPANLRSLCSWHHRAITGAQGGHALQEQKKAIRERFNAPRRIEHPGVIATQEARTQ